MYNNNAMFMKTFSGGTTLPEYKELTVDKKIRPIPAPHEVILPLLQHIGAPNEPLVKAGDYVKMGQKIAESKAFVSSPVHSPVSGTVKAIKNVLNPIFGKRPAFIIENDGKDEFLPLFEEKEVDNLSKEELINIIKEAGLVGLGGAAFPTHVKLNVPKGKSIHTLIVNGSECEPYLTGDHKLMESASREILKGVDIISRILDAKEIYIAIEENKLSAIFTMQKAVDEANKKCTKKIKIIILKTKYPQGGEKQLIKTILKREVPPGKLPLDIGALVQNVGTCLAIYQALYERKPLIERVVTMTGSSIKEPGNYLVRLGTPIRHLVDNSGGFVENPLKIIAGGPMMGIAQYTIDIPIIKGTTGILFLSKKEAEISEEHPCIRCAKCIHICPMDLLPTEIMRMSKYSRWHYLDELHPSDCMECGSCAYICPSKIPLTQYMKLAKMKDMMRK